MFLTRPSRKKPPLLLLSSRHPAHGLHSGRNLLLFLIVCMLIAGLTGLLRPGHKPDLPLLQKRFELLMTWTLPEVHWDDMHLSGLRKQGDEWLATYRFVVYAAEGADDSPAISTRLKQRFPECGDVLFQLGKACTVEERVRFINVPPYGLVPETVKINFPELLSQM